MTKPASPSSNGEQSHPATITNAVVNVNATLGNFNAKSLCESLFIRRKQIYLLRVASCVFNYQHLSWALSKESILGAAPAKQVVQYVCCHPVSCRSQS